MAERRPIFCVTHPRACSTAFERVFMTRKDLACVHEPFGDAFYYGPERMSIRYEKDEETRKASGFADSTFATIFDRLEQEGSDGKRVFIKDIIHYLLPPDGKPPQIAPSLLGKKRGVGTETNGHARASSTASVKGPLPFPYGTRSEPGNPTVIPSDLLRKFHYTFLIRDPHYSIPSYYRCTIPPLDDMTGFYNFYPSEAGYDEVRRVFDYLVSSGSVGPTLASGVQQSVAGNTKNNGNGAHTSDGTNGHSTSNGHSTTNDHSAPNGHSTTNGDSMTNGHSMPNGHSMTNGHSGSNGVKSASAEPDICVVDADDLLDNPAEMIEAYCETVGLDFSPDMLHWEDEDNQQRAKAAFEKWRGFHEDAIDSTELRARTHKKAMKTEDEFDREWTQKYGLKGANVIRQCVDANMATYHYLKQFAIQVTPRHQTYDPRDD